jgi:transcriptional regulator NrdR family protein
MIKNAKGHLEPFSRTKLLISIFDSIKHRNAPENEAGGLCDTVVADLISSLDGTVIKKHLIKQVCLSVLQPFDSTAGTYYRAYYR